MKLKGLKERISVELERGPGDFDSMLPLKVSQRRKIKSEMQ